MMKNYLLGAEAGDAIYALPAILALGGGHCYAVDRPWCRPDWVARSKSIKRLFEAQGVSLNQGTCGKVDYDLSTYRTLPALTGTPIALRIARHAGVSVDLSKPWLQVDPSPKTKGRIVVARGPRWQGYVFPWKKIVQTFQKDILFVGLDEEYAAFCQEFGSVERHFTTDLLDVAEAIAGSELFIGSQSSPNACCEGLKHPSVLEVCPTSLDCYYGRSSTKYCVDGSLSFEILGKKFETPPDWVGKNYFYRVLFNNNELRYSDPIGLKFLTRAQAYLQGQIYPLKQIEEDIEYYSHHQRAA